MAVPGYVRTMLMGVLLAGLSLLGAAQAQDRVALVIGNSAYAHASRLANPGNDATDMAAALGRLGFQVTRVDDATVDQMRRALRDFDRRSRAADVALVFFAGHGMELGGENYLVPIDAEMQSDRDIEHEAVTLRSVMNAVSGARRLGLVILDACRNDPFRPRMTQSANLTRTVSRGLGRIEPSGNLLVAFAAREGTVADDGKDRNSPFTAAMLRHLERPGLEVADLFREVRADVVETTNRRQEPAVYGSLGRERLFLSTPAQPTSAPLPNPAPTPDPAETAWGFINTTTDAAALRRFIEQFPNSRHRPAAEASLASLVGTRTQAAIETCDRLAAHPDDPSRPLSVKAVPFDNIDAQPAMIACREAVAARPDDSRLAFQLGRALEKGGQNEEAVRLYRRAAEMGSAGAIHNLGLMYRDGLGVTKDEAEAVRLYRRAADMGNADAITSLGWAYRNGSGVTRDDTEAARLYRRAADMGNAQAINNLGGMYLDGLGVTKDDTEAARLYRRAADMGNVMAIYNLGFMYSEGRGVAKDDAEAVRLYRRAADMGNAMAITHLGFMYSEGRGVAKDDAEAVRLYRRAADIGDPVAISNLGWAYENGRGVPRNRAEAIRWYEKAAAAGHADAQKDLDRLRRQP